MSIFNLSMIPIVTATLTGPQAAGADTVVAIPLRDGFDVIAAVTGGLIGATFLAVLLGFLFLLLQARKVSRALKETRQRISADPALEHLRETAANVEQITGTLRDEVGRLSKSVGDLSERLDQASERMEERIEEFNALMEVVQLEAEEVFVDTASTARGVRRGIGRLGEPRRRHSRRPSGQESRETRRSEPLLADSPEATEDRPDQGSTPPTGDPLGNRADAADVPSDFGDPESREPKA